MTPEAELLQQLREEIARGDMAIQACDEEFVGLVGKRYPFAGSKIDWDHIAGAVVKTMSTATLDCYYEDAERFVDEIAGSHSAA